jgi:hypothetical protein
MKEKIAQIDLTAEEVGHAIAAHISQHRLTAEHRWNSYTFQLRVRGGLFVGGTLRYFLELEDGGAGEAEVVVEGEQ